MHGTFLRLDLIVLLGAFAVGCNTPPRDGTVAQVPASSQSAPSTPLAASAMPSTPRRVSGVEARALVEKGALLVDVRTPAEFQADAVEGAINIPHDQIEARAAELGAKGRPVVLYCHSGRRSGIAARELSRLGHSVYDLGPRTAW